MSPNYQLSKVYRILSNEPDSLMYIGSTTKPLLSQRMSQHRSDYRLFKLGKVKKTNSFDVFDKYGTENCYIELLELYPCESKDELHKREGHYIRTTVNVNRSIAGQTRKEHYEANKEDIRNYMNEVIICPICRDAHPRSSLSAHKRTKKHQYASIVQPITQNELIIEKTTKHLKAIENEIIEEEHNVI